VAIFVAILILIPLTSSGFTGGGIISNAQAANACTGDWQPVVWNESIQRVAEVPFNWNYYSYWDYEADEMATVNPDIQNEYPLSPEQPYMYQDAWNRGPLLPLTEDYSTFMKVGNDSVGALRMNLSSDYRTTICVTLTHLVGETIVPAVGDVYLMTTSQYDSYTEAYSMHHNEWDWWQEIEGSLKNIDPEWRSFDIWGWRSFRDAHEYENVDEVALSISLDAPEIHHSIFGGDKWEDFYLVVDTWDNSHDSDADAPNKIVHADISIVTTLRSFVLPPWTVSLAFLAIVGSLMVAPIVVNRKYMGAGLGVEQEEFVPSLEIPPAVIHETAPKVVPPTPDLPPPSQ
jgi:hypothetical protein